MRHIMNATKRLIPIFFVLLLTLSVAAQEEAAAAEEAGSSGLALGLLMILVGVGAVMLVGLVLNQSSSNAEEE